MEGMKNSKEKKNHFFPHSVKYFGVKQKAFFNMEYIPHFSHANRESKYIIYRYLIEKGLLFNLLPL